MQVSSMDPVIDANLALALDALLAENSVTRAAERLHTSPAAMSRTLGRLRRILQDPLLVRAGQTMVPTPRAQALREEAAAVVRSLGTLLSPGASVDPASLRSTFTLQAADVLGAALAPGLLALARREAPGVSFRIRPEELSVAPDWANAVDQAIGVHDPRGRETGHQRLRHRDRQKPGVFLESHASVGRPRGAQEVQRHRDDVVPFLPRDGIGEPRIFRDVASLQVANQQQRRRALGYDQGLIGEIT